MSEREREGGRERERERESRLPPWTARRRFGVSHRTQRPGTLADSSGHSSNHEHDHYSPQMVVYVHIPTLVLQIAQSR